MDNKLEKLILVNLSRCSAKIKVSNKMKVLMISFRNWLRKVKKSNSWTSLQASKSSQDKKTSVKEKRINKSNSNNAREKEKDLELLRIWKIEMILMKTTWEM